MIHRAAGYLARNGPISPQDRWEENPGISPFTLGIEIVALVAAADHLPAEDGPYALSLADYWNERLEDWTYVESGAFIEEFGVEGYYVRIAPAMSEGGLCGRVDVRNRGGESVQAVALIGMEYLYLPRLGLRDPKDPRIQNTLKISESILKVETPHGIAYHRYNGDGYGEHDDGSPFDGTRRWPRLAIADRRARLSRCPPWHRSSPLPGDDDANDRTGRPHTGTGMGWTGDARTRARARQANGKRHAPRLGACGIFEPAGGAPPRTPTETACERRASLPGAAARGSDLALATRLSHLTGSLPAAPC